MLLRARMRSAAADAAVTGAVDMTLSIQLNSVESLSAEVGIFRLRPPLERDDVSSSRHPTQAFWLSMIFSENRHPPPELGCSRVLALLHGRKPETSDLRWSSPRAGFFGIMLQKPETGSSRFRAQSGRGERSPQVTTTCRKPRCALANRRLTSRIPWLPRRSKERPCP